MHSGLWLLLVPCLGYRTKESDCCDTGNVHFSTWLFISFRFVSFHFVSFRFVSQNSVSPSWAIFHSLGVRVYTQNTFDKLLWLNVCVWKSGQNHPQNVFVYRTACIKIRNKATFFSDDCFLKLDLVKTPYFTRAESNANALGPLFSVISIRFGSREVCH